MWNKISSRYRIRNRLPRTDHKRSNPGRSSMNLARFLDKDLIDTSLDARTKAGAVEMLADRFCRKYPEKNKTEILSAVYEREKIASTSVGRGFSFPHARVDNVDGMHIAIGVIKNGIDSGAADNIPLKVIFLLITPRNISRQYLQILSGLANFARRPGMLDKISNAKSPRDLIKLVEKEHIMVQKVPVVSEIMTKNPASVSPDDTLKKVAGILSKRNIESVAVIDSDGKIVGEISEKELLKLAFPDYGKFITDLVNLPEFDRLDDFLHNENKVRAGDVMNREIVTVPSTTQVVEVAALMLHNNIDRVMVLKDGKLAGIVTRSSIISRIVRG